MKLEKIERNGHLVALVQGDGPVIVDTQSALDLLMTAKYELGTKNIAIDKDLICPDFFILSTGMAGEILQKYVNYGAKIAIYGDWSCYTSKPLHDFIYESNQGKDVFFTADRQTAVERLTRA